MQGQMHANFKNSSSNIRLIQFVRQIVARETRLATKPDRYAPARVFRAYPLPEETKEFLDSLTKAEQLLFDWQP